MVFHAIGIIYTNGKKEFYINSELYIYLGLNRHVIYNNTELIDLFIVNNDENTYTLNNNIDSTINVPFFHKIEIKIDELKITQ